VAGRSAAFRSRRQPGALSPHGRPEHLQEIHERIAGSELRGIPDGSRLCFAERPDTYLQLVEDFFDRVEAAAGL